MPLDEKEKEELKKRYKEHRQSIWFGKHSRKLKKRKKDKRDVDDLPAVLRKLNSQQGQSRLKTLPLLKNRSDVIHQSWLTTKNKIGW